MLQSRRSPNIRLHLATDQQQFIRNSELDTAAAKSLQLCPTLCDPHRWQPTRLPHPWDSPGKNTGVGRHFLLQGMKVKSESEVPQSCPTLSDPMDCSLPGSSVHGICQAKVPEWGAIAFSGTRYQSPQKKLEIQRICFMFGRGDLPCIRSLFLFL